MQVRVDIGPLLNNWGIADPGSGPEAGFNLWRNTFPCADLPQPGGVVRVDGIEFDFPVRGQGEVDNVRCQGQYLPVPPGRYEWLYLLGAAERRTEDQVLLRDADGAERAAWLRMSDFWPDTPAWFDEPLAFRAEGLAYPRHVQDHHRPSIWQQRIAVAVAGELVGLRLPDNAAMHVFALTAVSDAEARCAL